MTLIRFCVATVVRRTRPAFYMPYLWSTFRIVISADSERLSLFSVNLLEAFNAFKPCRVMSGARPKGIMFIADRHFLSLLALCFGRHAEKFRGHRRERFWQGH